MPRIHCPANSHKDPKFSLSVEHNNGVLVETLYTSRKNFIDDLLFLSHDDNKDNIIAIYWREL